MAINSAFLRRPTDSKFFWAAAIAFPLIVLVGYAKTYYFKAFFDVPPIANSLVHWHAITMSAWVLFFVAQTVLIRTKNVKLHMSMGLAGIGLAAIVAIVGFATGYDSNLVRRVGPPGVDPHEFFIIPTGDMVIFVLLFAAAVYYRKKSVEHKSLMLLTAINFAPAAISRIPGIPPDYFLLVAFGGSALAALVSLAYFTYTRRKLSVVALVATIAVLAAFPVRLLISKTEAWHEFVRMIAP